MDKMQGLYEKYTIMRNEGSPPFKGEHFVLKPMNDPWAVCALQAYATACEPQAPCLANDIRAWLNDIAEEQACISDAESTAAFIAREKMGELPR